MEWENQQSYERPCVMGQPEEGRRTIAPKPSDDQRTRIDASGRCIVVHLDNTLTTRVASLLIHTCNRHVLLLARIESFLCSMGLQSSHCDWSQRLWFQDQNNHVFLISPSVNHSVRWKRFKLSDT